MAPSEDIFAISSWQGRGIKVSVFCLEGPTRLPRALESVRETVVWREQKHDCVKWYMSFWACFGLRMGGSGLNQPVKDTENRPRR